VEGEGKEGEEEEARHDGDQHIAPIPRPAQQYSLKQLLSTPTNMRQRYGGCQTVRRWRGSCAWEREARDGHNGDWTQA
jgi:hypothetical protein